MRRIGPLRGLLLLFGCAVGACRAGAPPSAPRPTPAEGSAELSSASPREERAPVPAPLTPPALKPVLSFVDARGVRYCAVHRPELARTLLLLELEPTPRPELTALLQAWLEARGPALASSALTSAELTWSPATPQLGAALTALSTGSTSWEAASFARARARALELLRASEEDPTAQPFVHLERLGAATWDAARSPLVGSAFLAALDLRAARGALEPSAHGGQVLVSSPHEPEAIRAALAGRPLPPVSATAGSQGSPAPAGSSKPGPTPTQPTALDAAPSSPSSGLGEAVLWPSEGAADWVRAFLAFPPGTPRGAQELLVLRLATSGARRGVLVEGSRSWPGLRLSGPVELVHGLAREARAELARAPSNEEQTLVERAVTFARSARSGCEPTHQELTLPRALHLVVQGPEEPIRRTWEADTAWQIAEPTRLGAPRRTRAPSPPSEEPSPL